MVFHSCVPDIQERTEAGRKSRRRNSSLFCLVKPCATTSTSKAESTNTGIHVYICFHYVHLLTSTPALSNFKKKTMSKGHYHLCHYSNQELLKSSWHHRSEKLPNVDRTGQNNSPVVLLCFCYSQDFLQLPLCVSHQKIQNTSKETPEKPLSSSSLNFAEHDTFVTF